MSLTRRSALSTISVLACAPALPNKVKASNGSAYHLKASACRIPCNLTSAAKHKCDQLVVGATLEDCAKQLDQSAGFDLGRRYTPRAPKGGSFIAAAALAPELLTLGVIQGAASAKFTAPFTDYSSTLGHSVQSSEILIAEHALEAENSSAAARARYCRAIERSVSQALGSVNVLVQPTSKMEGWARIIKHPSLLLPSGVQLTTDYGGEDLLLSLAAQLDHTALA
ncbi:MAG: hypothetical protein AAF607_12075 [Pseudomonadota bacterium]